MTTREDIARALDAATPATVSPFIEQRYRWLRWQQERIAELEAALANLASGGDSTTIGDADCGEDACIGCRRFQSDGPVHESDCRWVAANAALAALEDRP